MVFLLIATLSGIAGADPLGVGILVLREHGVGSAAQAQPYVDKLVELAASQNGWANAYGRYHTQRSGAEDFIRSDKPHYGVLSLGAYLAFREPHKLTVIGQVEVTQGGRQYHLVSKSGAGVADCKGKKLASDHLDDPKLIEKIVAAGAFKLSDFTLVETRRPLQTIKAVVRDEAACALIDDAQLAELSKVDGGAPIRSIWQSGKLPSMVIVAFARVRAAERDAFKGKLGKLCTESGKTTCAEVGLLSLSPASDGDYASLVKAYGK